MNRRHTAQRGGWLRRITALALAILGLWLFSLTGAIQGAFTQLSQLGQQGAITVALFPLPLGETAGLLPDSALLTASQDAIWTRLGQSSASASASASAENSVSAESDDQIQILTPLTPTQSPIYAQGDDDGGELPDLTVTENVINYTAGGDDSGNYILADSLYIANRSLKHLDSDDITPLLGGDYSLEEGAKILIIHTHGTEAYTPAGTDSYVESDPYRTTNNLQNIVQVGADMAAYFRQAGYTVLHDTNLYDYPDYNSSYSNSRASVENWLAQYPDIALILDVHRDALTAQDGTPYRLIGASGDTAQIMMVVGSNDNAAHPNWETNFSLALQLQQQLTEDWGDLIRPTTLRSSSFNQDLSTAFLLVEIGGHGNTLQDARNAALCFAQSVVTALEGEG